jgi:hypothetical protein
VATIYRPIVAAGYEWVHPGDGVKSGLFSGLNGEPRGPTWTAVPVKRVSRGDNQIFHASDFPWLGNYALIMRQRAVDALRDLLERNGELLPLTSDVPLWVLNTQTIDALDEENSSIVRFKSSGAIMTIDKLALIESRIGDCDIFKIPMRASATYVSERFVQRVKDAALIGLEFRPVWSA